MDQLAIVIHQLGETVKTALPGNLLPPKERDTYKLDFPFSEFLGSLNLFDLELLFQPLE